MACTGAAVSGKIALLQWLRANGCPWDKNTFLEAQKARMYLVCDWLQQNQLMDNG